MAVIEAKNIVVESTAQQASARAAEIFRTIVKEVTSQRDLCRVALSGGSTPRAAYHHLASQVMTDGLPWPMVEIFLGDERDVPQDDTESNFYMIQRILLDNTPVNWERVHPMRADAEDIEAAANEYEQIIRQRVPAGPGGVPQFDLIMLGLGADGHIASLFPDSPAIEERRRLVVASYVPVIRRHRMSLTFPLINAARNILLLVTGSDKAEVVRQIIQGDEPHLPASWISPRDGTVHIVLDADAARLLYSN